MHVERPLSRTVHWNNIYTHTHTYKAQANTSHTTWLHRLLVCPALCIVLRPSIHTAILIIVEGQFQVFQLFPISKLGLKPVERCFIAFNYYGIGARILWRDKWSYFEDFLFALHSALCCRQHNCWHAALQYKGAIVHALHLSNLAIPLFGAVLPHAIHCDTSCASHTLSASGCACVFNTLWL